MFERAIAKHDIVASESYMIGDKERDLIPARKLGIATIILNETVVSKYADYSVTGISKVMQAIGV
jgi:D-glycero-D-manno-heptose 1,7-bisphosphate phosphatase